MPDQQRLSDLVGLVERRARAQPRTAVLGAYVRKAPVEMLEEVGPIGRAVLQQRDQIGDADDRDRAAEYVRREGGPDERGIAAIGAAHNRHLVALGYALGDRPFHAVDEVVMHLAGVLLVAGVEERLAESP